MQINQTDVGVWGVRPGPRPDSRLLENPKPPKMDCRGLGLAALSYPVSPCIIIFIVRGSMRNFLFRNVWIISSSCWRPCKRFAKSVRAPMDTADAIVPGSWRRWRSLRLWRCRRWIYAPMIADKSKAATNIWTATALERPGIHYNRDENKIWNPTSATGAFEYSSLAQGQSPLWARNIPTSRWVSNKLSKMRYV